MGSLIGVPLGTPACGPQFRSHLAAMKPFGVLNLGNLVVLFLVLGWGSLFVVTDWGI